MTPLMLTPRAPPQIRRYAIISIASLFCRIDAIAPRRYDATPRRLLISLFSHFMLDFSSRFHFRSRQIVHC